MLRSWNGRSFLEAFNSANVALDASSGAWLDGGPGIGGYCYHRNEYFACGVPSELADWPICDLELIAYLLATRLWHQHWHSHSVSFLTDNESCRYLLESGRSRDPRRLQIVRLLVEEQFTGNFRLQTARITTEDNLVADALSRLGQPGKPEVFTNYCKGYGVVPTRLEIPPEFFSLQSRISTGPI